MSRFVLPTAIFVLFGILHHFLSGEVDNGIDFKTLAETGLPTSGIPGNFWDSIDLSMGDHCWYRRQDSPMGCVVYMKVTGVTSDNVEFAINQLRFCVAKRGFTEESDMNFVHQARQNVWNDVPNWWKPKVGDNNYEILFGTPEPEILHTYLKGLQFNSQTKVCYYFYFHRAR